MNGDFYDKLSDLRAAQTETHILLRGLTEKVEKYIDSDDVRHQELVEFRVKVSENLASAAVIIQDMKKDLDRTVATDIPALQKEQACQKATLGAHTWLIRAMVGVTLLAVLGGTVTTLATCEVGQGRAEAAPLSVASEPVDSGLADADVDGEVE